ADRYLDLLLSPTRRSSDLPDHLQETAEGGPRPGQDAVRLASGAGVLPGLTPPTVGSVRSGPRTEPQITPQARRAPPPPSGSGWSAWLSPPAWIISARPLI